MSTYQVQFECDSCGHSGTRTREFTGPEPTSAKDIGRLISIGVRPVKCPICTSTTRTKAKELVS